MPLLLRLPPETAHRATIAALKHAPCPPTARSSRGLRSTPSASPFPIRSAWRPASTRAPKSPSGVAGAWLRLRRSRHADAAPAKRQSQAPVVSAWRATTAVVNRMGFNNDGYGAAAARLAARPAGGIVGVNFGTEPRRRRPDRRFRRGVKTFAPSPAISRSMSPRPTRRACAICNSARAFDELAARVAEAREAATPRRPLLIKIAPDLDLRGLDNVIEVCRARGVDGIIVANTTTRARVAQASRRVPSRRPLGPAAVRAFDAHAGARLLRCRGP